MTNKVPTSIRTIEKQYKGHYTWPLDGVEYKIDFVYGEMLVAGFTAPSPIPIPAKGDTIGLEYTSFLVVDVRVSYSTHDFGGDKGRTMTVSATVNIRPVDPGYAAHA